MAVSIHTQCFHTTEPPMNPKPIHHLKVYKYTTQEARQPQDIKKPIPKHSRQLSIRFMDTPFRGPTILALNFHSKELSQRQFVHTIKSIQWTQTSDAPKAPRYFRSWTCQQPLRCSCQQPLRWIGNRSAYFLNTCNPAKRSRNNYAGHASNPYAGCTRNPIQIAQLRRPEVKKLKIQAMPRKTLIHYAWRNGRSL